MRVSYACTFEDFVEVQRAHRTPSRAERASVWERLLFVGVLLAMFALVFAAMFAAAMYAVVSGGSPDATGVVVSYVVSIATPLMMWTIAFAAVWFAFAPSMTRQTRRAARSFLLLVLGVVLVLNVIDAVTSGPHPAAADDAPAGRRESLLTALTPWVVIFLLLWFVIFRYLRGAARRAWDAQPQLGLPQTLEQTERGLRLDNGRATFDYTWSAFTKFRESDNVFLLYISDLAIEMVPKRAFAEPGGIDAFRQLLQQHLPNPDAVPAVAAGAAAVPIRAFPT